MLLILDLFCIRGVRQPTSSINNVRFEPRYDGTIDRLFNFLSQSISLNLLLTISLLILRTVLPEIMFFLLSIGSFLFVRDHPPLEHIHVAVDELKHPEPLDLRRSNNAVEC